MTDDSARVVGILTQTDLLDKAAWDARGPRMGARERVALTMRRGRRARRQRRRHHDGAVTTIGPDDDLPNVVPAMSALGIHHLPVTGPDGRLVGIVSQTDLVVALLADAARRGERGGLTRKGRRRGAAPSLHRCRWISSRSAPCAANRRR